VHLRDKQLFADHRIVLFPWEKDVGIRKDGKEVKPEAETSKSDAKGKKSL